MRLKFSEKFSCIAYTLLPFEGKSSDIIIQKELNLETLTWLKVKVSWSGIGQGTIEDSIVFTKALATATFLAEHLEDMIPAGQKVV